MVTLEVIGDIVLYQTKSQLTIVQTVLINNIICLHFLQGA